MAIPHHTTESVVWIFFPISILKKLCISPQVFNSTLNKYWEYPNFPEGQDDLGDHLHHFYTILIKRRPLLKGYFNLNSYGVTLTIAEHIIWVQSTLVGILKYEPIFNISR